MADLNQAVASIQEVIASYDQRIADLEHRLAQIAELAHIPQPEPEQQASE